MNKYPQEATMAEYIPELKKLIKTNRIKEARNALSSLADRPAQDKQAVIELLALAPDQTAHALLSFLMEDSAIDQDTRSRLYQLTTDRAHIDYAFASILLAHGSPDQIRQIIPLLKHVLSKETKGDLLNTILRVVGKLKLESLVDDVVEFIFYDDPDLKQESVKALERMGTASALQRLEQVAATDKCDQDIIDAIDMLKERVIPVPEPQTPATAQVIPASVKAQQTAAQATQTKETAKPVPPAAKEAPEEDWAIEANITLLASDRLEDRHKAYLYFSDQGARVAQALHNHMDTQDQDLLINLLRLAARTIPLQILGDLLNLADQKDIEKPIKFAICNALAAFPKLESAAAIIGAVTDPSMYIRMAAVNALERHCSDYIIAEIKNQIETGTKKGEALAISVLDARASKLIDALMDSDTFSYISSNYLERSASVQVIDNYISVLEKRNRKSTVKKYSKIRLERTNDASPFFVVIHHSQTVLDVYAKLIHGCGYEARTFTAPQEAFESIVFEKPMAVICDIFLAQLTALDLAKEIRELYTPKQVPIIVSSLQKNLDKKILDAQFKAAGINDFWEFPPSPKQIKSWDSTR